MNIVTDTLRKVYVFLFARKALYSVNLLIYKLSMRGLGVMNYENDHVSGESAFIKYMKATRKLDTGVVLDVGANVGHYSVMLRQKNIHLPIYAFEPHPVAYSKLEKAASAHSFVAVPRGAGNRPERTVIYDYAGNTGSEHASMYREVISGFRDSEVAEVTIDITTIDEFIEEKGITEVALLKIDTEGHELNVLKGAATSIANGLINVVQIEFNEMNVISRTFFKDIIDILPGYRFYRLLPDGLKEMGKYNAAAFEIFAFQNIVAIRD
ncbi:FkbM family methyltransferase [Chitinophaga tropicalis]|uniref:FkbM family methyltransferase n=1 Tax=Chitinophaga tropicalis TaxID=2683588 RepID=A0A7K1U8I9_9BACT|nr:FkbM family methyltransferase [Chitinophaga tropicalis]MVT10608.1 FkbM family methyltransferase [Chitinophaga tropicalis]